MNVFALKNSIAAALLLWLVATAAARADATEAYVHFGAILLGEAPAGNHDARRQRVGYLPIGTLVRFDSAAPKTRIFNYSEDVQDYEDYIQVHSDIGFSGYIRDDLVTPLDDREILLPLRYHINIRAPDSNDVIAQISRAADKNSSTPVEILGEEPDYYRVRLRRGGDAGSSPVEGRISKPLVDGERLVRLAKSPNRALPDIRVGSPAEFVDRQLSEFSELVSEKSGAEANRIFDFLRELNALRCRLSSAADAELSAKIFANGLGLKFSFVLAEKNAIYSIKTLSYSIDGRQYASFYELHDVRCIDGIPHRLANLILLDRSDPANQVIVSATDLPPELGASWARFDTGGSSKMFFVDGFTAYERFMRHIRQAPFLRRLPPRDRLILSHALLKELAHFSTPE